MALRRKEGKDNVSGGRRKGRKGGETLRRKRERKGKLEKRCLGGAVPVNERW